MSSTQAVPAVNSFKPRVLQPARIGRCESLVDYHGFQGRPTAVGAFVYSKEEVLLVRSSSGDSWGFAQGGFQSSDKTIAGTVRREAFSEVGLREQHLLGFEELLGECLNPMPSDRDVGYTHKHLFVLAVPVKRTDWVTLNHENNKYEWVHSSGHLMLLIGPRAKTRPVKYQAILDTIDLMHERRLLNWSSGQTVQ